MSNSNDDEDDDRLENSLLMDNTNVHWEVQVMDTVAESMYYIHNEDMDDNVVDEEEEEEEEEDDDDVDGACL